MLGAAIVGLTVQSPLVWLASHRGINVLIAVLVFATALTVEPAALRRLGALWRPLVVVVATGITVLPALSWLASTISVMAGSLRDGIMVVGLAPCEIASVATTAMADGAGCSRRRGSDRLYLDHRRPGRTSPRPRGRTRQCPPREHHRQLGSRWHSHSLGASFCELSPHSATGPSDPPTSSLSPRSRPVALIASEVHLSRPYFAVALALISFLGASALLGRLLGLRSHRPACHAILLTTSMRDFAIAAISPSPPSG